MCLLYVNEFKHKSKILDSRCCYNCGPIAKLFKKTLVPYAGV
jgi:hypothetical protein